MYIHNVNEQWTLDKGRLEQNYSPMSEMGALVTKTHCLLSKCNFVTMQVYIFVSIFFSLSLKLDVITTLNIVFSVIWFGCHCGNSSRDNSWK